MPSLPGAAYPSLALGLLSLWAGVGGGCASHAPEPAALRACLDHVEPLPRYEESYYHPLGRSPAVDAVLADPAYIVTYAKTVSGSLRAAADSNSCSALLDSALRGAAVPISSSRVAAAPAQLDLPPSFTPAARAAVQSAWADVLEARRRATAALAPLTEDERRAFLERPDSYFFGPQGGNVNDFWTTNVDHILKVFTQCARIDLVELAEASRLLASAGDALLAARADLRTCRLDKPFRFKRDGAVLLIAGAGDDRHTEDADLLIDLGGNDTYTNSAGGTYRPAAEGPGSTAPASLLVDLDGDDVYQSAFGGQGAGFLGVGGLIDAAGNDLYRAGDYSQAAGWLGSGFLFDLAGDDQYTGAYFVQGAATFGFALLCDRAGNDGYDADGMAQAAASTLGAAFLVDSRGDDRYSAGGPRRDRFTRAHSAAQGGVVGVRDYPWLRRPAFYAGLAFFDDAAGDDVLRAFATSQGGGYFLGAAIHVNSGGNDRYFSADDSLGSTIHLAAACCIKEGGNDVYHNASCALGIGGDRGTGVFIDTGGDDVYRTNHHSIGSARKPHGYGLFIDAAGNDRYEIGAESMSEVQRPASPALWPRALFADLGGRDIYPPTSAGLDRNNDRGWNFEGHGAGIDTSWVHSVADLFALFPPSPRGFARFDPTSGWSDNQAFRPLIDSQWPWEPGAAPTPDAASPDAQRAAAAWIAEVPRASYDQRRRLYERLDLLRSIAPASVDWSIIADLLRNPAGQPADQLAFAAVWCELDKNAAALPLVADDLRDGRVQSPLARGLLIRMAGQIEDPAAIEVLKARLADDDDASCRRYAAEALVRRAPDDLDAVRRAVSDPSEQVRWAACRGLRDCRVPECAPLLESAMRDDSVFVRRQAALAAISLGDKAAVDQLFDDLKVASLDTGWNYGQNIFVDLAPYLASRLSQEQAAELGTSLDKWTRWWTEHRAEVDLQPRPGT